MFLHFTVDSKALRSLNYVLISTLPTQNFAMSCLSRDTTVIIFVCIIEPLQKLRARLCICKTSLSPPVILYCSMTFCFSFELFVTLKPIQVNIKRGELTY